jgi:hypothetical protein
VLAVDRSDLTGRLRRAVLQAAVGTGGWPYYAGKSSRIEPTCWALLALSESPAGDAVAQQAAESSLRFLAACQRADGLLVDTPGAPPNLNANGLAACVVSYVASAFRRTESLLPRLLDGIAAMKGVAIDSGDKEQDDTLQGWPWIPQTFSWVEPTCWCALALKKTRSQTKGADARIQVADKLLLNRGCEAGGWNFGNARKLAQDLRPYVPTTALGLIALQDRRDDPVVARALAHLEQAQTSEPSAMALSLAALALRIYDRPADEVDARLAADVDRAERMGNVQGLAMMLYALTGAQHGVRALRV